MSARDRVLAIQIAATTNSARRPRRREHRGLLLTGLLALAAFILSMCAAFGP